MTAFAVLPVIQVFALGVAFWTGRRNVDFSSAVDRFFAGSAPWFLAFAVVGAFGAIASPILAAQWFARLAVLTFVTAIIASLRIDFVFFRDLLGRPRSRALTDLAVQRAVAWGLTTWFMLASSAPKLGSAIPEVALRLIGARP